MRAGELDSGQLPFAGVVGLFAPKLGSEFHLVVFLASDVVEAVAKAVISAVFDFDEKDSFVALGDEVDLAPFCLPVLGNNLITLAEEVSGGGIFGFGTSGEWPFLIGGRITQLMKRAKTGTVQ